MNDLVALRERTRDVEATLPPAARRRLAVGRVLDRAMGLGLPVAVPLAMFLATRHGPSPEATTTMLLGLAFGFGLAVLRRPLLTRVYRSVLGEAGAGLHAVGGATSVALPSFGAPKSPSPSPAPPRFVEPVRPPPRVGDPDADDFDD